MKIWTIEEEASALRARFEGVNRAAFARSHQIKGGQAMIYQHITGRRPLNLEAATAYAQGLGCSLADISPRLAAEAQKAAALTSDAALRVSPTEAPWPFPSTPEADVRALPAADIQLLDSILAGAMKAILNRSTPSKSMAEQVLNASGLSETPKKKIRETEK
ncbi:hypothetical protein IB259_00175 [Achromobacter sp. ACM04]|uniref:hypothetical protein n=1 Tax=Achromobacter sp. ACM04 TaxID=2769312 RepID=UPI001780104C|nr:hypothetical protein [Achromobacter sp. ACM04]MBD9417635.1 hypothetical protein [Achromobacter sp. ACM04]